MQRLLSTSTPGRVIRSFLAISHPGRILHPRYRFRNKNGIPPSRRRDEAALGRGNGATEVETIISDELNHASIIDGVRLSKARKERYKNRDLDDLRRARGHEGRAQQTGVLVTSHIARAHPSSGLRPPSPLMEGRRLPNYASREVPPLSCLLPSLRGEGAEGG